MDLAYSENLADNHYQIVCTDCYRVLFESEGDLVSANRESMRFNQCDNCGSRNLVIKHHFTCEPNRYDANHPYPDGI